MTINWTVNPTKKKKSNLRRAMKIYVQQRSIQKPLHINTLQSGGTYLELEISLLHFQICTDMLVDGPCKFVIQLPTNNAHQHGRQGDYAGNCNQRRLNHWPDIFLDTKIGRALSNTKLPQEIVCVVNLIHLDGGVDKQCSIENANAYDLNGVLQSKCIIAKNYKEYMPKDEEGQVSIKQTSVRYILCPTFYYKKVGIDSCNKLTLEWFVFVLFDRRFHAW